MASPAAVLDILVKANTAAAVVSLRQLQGELAATDVAAKRSAGAFASMGAGAARLRGVGSMLSKNVTAPLALVGGAAFVAAKNFNQAMELVHTQAGASQKEVNRLKGEVLALAKASPQGPTQLANALYRLEGAGIRGSKAMRALKAASDLAAVGNADVEDTAKTLAQTWFSGIRGAGNFRKVVAELNATVGAGDLRLQQLVDALGVGILPVAHTVGLTLRDITGVLATFGDETNNVSGWTAQLATALHFLYNPTAKAEGALNAIGLSGARLGEDFKKPRGLLTALKDLRSHLAAMPGGIHGIKAIQTLGTILPGGRGRVLTVLLSQLDRYEAKLNQVGGTTGKFGEAIRRTHEQMANRLKTAWSSIQVAAVQLGNALGPVILPIVEKVAGAIGTLAQKFSDLDPHMKTLVVTVGVVAAAAGPLIGIVGALGAALAGPALPIAALAAAGVLIAQNWGTIGPIFASVGASLASFGQTVAGGFMAGINAIVGAAQTVANSTAGIRSAFATLGSDVGAAVSAMAGVLSTVFGPAVATTGAAFSVLSGVISASVNFWSSVLMRFAQVVMPVFTAAWHVLTAVARAAMDAVVGILQAAYTVIDGVVKLIAAVLTLNFGAAWRAVKQIFSGGVQAVVTVVKLGVDLVRAGVQGWFDAIKGVLGRVPGFVKGVFGDAIKAMTSVTGTLISAVAEWAGRVKDAITKPFETAANAVIDFINAIIRAINAIPFVPNIGLIAHVGGGGGGGKASPKDTASVTHGGGAGQRATGGMVDRPMVIVGEEAPKHPEVVLATNPAYRQRNLGLWAQAGSMLGVPGFQFGGVLNLPGKVIGGAGKVARGALGLAGKSAGFFLDKLPDPGDLPDLFRGTGKYLLAKAGDYIKSKATAALHAVGIGGHGVLGAGTAGDNQKLGKAMMLQMFPASEWPALRTLWQNESGWRTNADNPNSTAYGIPQALPGSKMASAGADWATNPHTQIAWGLAYIRDRYGTPSKALAAWQSRSPHWYRRGGILGLAKGGILGHVVARLAQGGFIPMPGTNFTYGKEPQIVADLRKLARITGTNIYGISGYRTPQHSVAVGGFANDPHTRGEAVDFGFGAPTRSSAARVSDAMLKRVGLWRPFKTAAEINHVQLLGGAAGTGTGGAGAGRTSRHRTAVRSGAISTGKTPQRAVGFTPSRTAMNAAPIGPGLDILDMVQRALDHIDLLVRAGVVSPTEGQARKLGELSEMIPVAKGMFGQSSDQYLTLLADQQDILAANTDALQQQNDLLQQQLDLANQQAADAKRLAAVSQSQYGALKSEIARIANGVIGGRVGLGFATPSYPGRVAKL